MMFYYDIYLFKLQLFTNCFPFRTHHMGRTIILALLSGSQYLIEFQDIEAHSSVPGVAPDI